MKEAVLHPKLKKASLDCEELSNYRPISNLTFISKACERVVAKQLTHHLHNNNLLEPLQSAYKPQHSTETALIKVQNDILLALDKNKCVILLLLDLSAAFDTVDHQTLLHRLDNLYGITGTALEWFTSYLTRRKQFVAINNVNSYSCPLNCGVPQGSVLGPILYSLYTAPLGYIFRRHDVLFHLYADDTQIYCTFETSTVSDIQHAKFKLEECVRDIDLWMLENNLKLNDDKTEILVFHAKHRPAPSLDFLQVANASVAPSDSAKNIGTIFDTTVSLDKQIAQVCKSAFFSLRNIASIRKFLSYDATKTLVHAFVTAKLDNCNSLFYGLPKHLLQRLQYVLNSAARLITLSRKSEHVTPLLIELHWLPIEKRVEFKILLYTYKAVNGLAPHYLEELLHPYIPRRSLRSADKCLLTSTSHNLKSYGFRAFSVCAPRLWNAIPIHIRQSGTIAIFKKQLKTFLFKDAFY